MSEQEKVIKEGKAEIKGESKENVSLSFQIITKEDK